MGSLRRQLFFISVPFIFFACSTDFTSKPCATDGDCGTGNVCELRASGSAQTPVCVHATDATINIGESAPISGTNYALGTEMRRGVQMAFDEQNAKGGIRGRMLNLIFSDDGYDPPTAEKAARMFVDAQVSMTDPPKCPSTAVPESDGHVPPMSYPVSMTAIDRGPNAVLAELGTVGTPTMVRAAPVVIETHTLYFGPFTGAGKILRDTLGGDCTRYIFNVRASYAQEAEATAELFKARGVIDYRYLMSFDQKDTFGDAGFNGLTAAYALNWPNAPGPIQRFQYVRNDDTSVPAQAVAAEGFLANLLNNVQPTGTVNVGIMMTDTYGAGTGFVTALRNWQFDGMTGATGKDTRLKLDFSNVSFVGPNALASNLATAPKVNCTGALCPTGQMSMTQDVTVSQVVPNYETDTSDIVTQYNKLIAANMAAPTFTSLEGYLDGRIFIAGLLAHNGPFTPDSLINTFENLPDLSLGIGATAGFQSTAALTCSGTSAVPCSHQYSQSVWGTSVLADGTFKNLYFWTQGQAIQFFQ